MRTTCLLILGLVASTSALKLELKDDAAAVDDVAPNPVRRARQTYKETRGIYTDPNHPGCARAVIAKGRSLTIHGTDGSPGCVDSYAKQSRDGLTKWTVTGTILTDLDAEHVVDKVSVDFSSKGGPDWFEGEFTADGLKWQDGNVWKLTTIVERNYADSNHPGCPRTVNFDQGIVVFTGADGPDGGNGACQKGRVFSAGEDFEIYGHSHGDQIVLDFSPKGGPPDLTGTVAEDGITWSDGNKWLTIPSDEPDQEFAFEEADHIDDEAPES